jgi:hypothetical protein
MTTQCKVIIWNTIRGLYQLARVIIVKFGGLNIQITGRKEIC